MGGAGGEGPSSYGAGAEGGSGEGDVGDGGEAGGIERPEGGVGVGAEGDSEWLVSVFVDENEAGVWTLVVGEVGGVGGGAGAGDG